MRAPSIMPNAVKSEEHITSSGSIFMISAMAFRPSSWPNIPVKLARIFPSSFSSITLENESVL